MIKINEVRIGNWFSYNGADEEMQIDTTDFQYVINGHITDIEPIPLTEEWLIKFGFEKQMSWTYRKHIEGNNFLVYYLGEKGWSINNKPYSDFKCKYVHSLQNLYFAITGDELTPLH